MSARCLSTLGPPPHCGHKPTADNPVCALCEESYRRYCEEAERKLVETSIRALRSRGYTVLTPVKEGTK